MYARSCNFKNKASLRNIITSTLYSKQTSPDCTKSETSVMNARYGPGATKLKLSEL